jgi:CheY-like chemotaxis protein
MNGFDLLDKIRKLPKISATPVVFFSAIEEFAGYLLCRALGARCLAQTCIPTLRSGLLAAGASRLVSLPMRSGHQAANGLHSVTVVASLDITVAERAQQLINSEYFCAFTSTDIVGVELGGALKNVMQAALVKTLAHKYKMTVSRVYRKYRSTQVVDGQKYQTLEVRVPAFTGERTFIWGGIPLKAIKPALFGVTSIHGNATLLVDDVGQTKHFDLFERNGIGSAVTITSPNLLLFQFNHGITLPQQIYLSSDFGG